MGHRLISFLYLFNVFNHGCANTCVTIIDLWY